MLNLRNKQEHKTMNHALTEMSSLARLVPLLVELLFARAEKLLGATACAATASGALAASNIKT